MVKSLFRRPSLFPASPRRNATQRPWSLPRPPRWRPPMSPDRFRLPWTTLIAGLLLPWGAQHVVRADDPPTPTAVPAPSGTSTVDFDREIRPLFAKHCISCHGPTRQKGSFRLDRQADALSGGGSGRAFEPGASGESLLVRYVSGLDPDMVMPPKGERLTANEIQRIRDWIDQGAKWPAEDGENASEAGASRLPGSDHWAFQPIQAPAPPAVNDPGWLRNPLDAFVLAHLDRENVRPAPEADRFTLIRRLSLDLRGLPPTLAEVDAFVQDARPDAYERLVDRLLNSPHYGERWGRHWLDLARYADSDGYEKDSPRPNAYRYRDWVIDALNRDLPFDAFTISQIAGDLLPNADWWTRTATGFHRNTLTNKEGGVDQEEYRVKAVVDRVNTTGTVWLGLTVGCAQCHSHKYDPISQKAYYGLFAFFNTQKEDELPDPTRPATEKPASKKAADAKKAPPAPAIPVLVENPSPPKTHILIRGDFLRPGEEIRPFTPAFLPQARHDGPDPSRLDFARWLVSDENPLTPRVTVNRIWNHLFGRPLVATADDFGLRGEKPSHPLLLDWLATEFRRNGWSQKGLIRTIVCSATYRQSSATRPELLDRDPNNVWLARQSRVRLEAEILRDASLSVSGLLAPRIGGPSVRPPQPPGISELTYAGAAKWVESQGPDRFRRGLYTWFQRTSPYPMLMTFDAPDSNVCVVKRERSNTPLQSLTLLNDRIFVDCHQALGRRMESEFTGNVEERIRAGFRVCLGRAPSGDETKVLEGLFHDLETAFQGHPEQARALLGAPRATHEAQIQGAAWVALARTMMNLDEFVTRE